MHHSLRGLLAVGTTAVLALSSLATASPAAHAADPVSLSKAAGYLAQNLPTSDDGMGAALGTANALAATADCTYAPALTQLVGQLTKGAQGYLYPGGTLNPARAANLAITVEALGYDSRNFAGHNLQVLIKTGLPDDGQIGSSSSTFNQSLAIIALKRGEATIPVEVLTKMLSLQTDDGAEVGSFGYEWGGTLNADPDSTGMGLMALQAVGELDPQMAAALTWAKSKQLPDGSWPNEFSPVDTTGILGAAVKAAGGDTEATAALEWLATQQLSDGGFPDVRDGQDSNRVATANAIWLIAGKTPLDVSLDLRGCDTAPKLPASTTSCTGVWVVVDRGFGDRTTRCATRYSNGLAALTSAGVAPTTFASAFGEAVCQVAGYPTTCDETWTLGFWSYWHASPNADGTWGDWQSYGVGAAGSTPVKGAAEGWRWIPAGWDTANPTILPPKGYSATAKPSITGSRKVGRTLKAVVGTWDPKPGFSYRWYRDGKAISGATKSSYKLTKANIGKRMTVKVTGKRSGYQTVAVRSSATSKVRK